MSSIIANEDTLYSFFNYKMSKDNNGKHNRVELTYEIPCYQRSFSWEEKHYQELVDDIYEAYKKKNTYYIGNIIYYKNEEEFNSYYIVDGQQRLTSIVLLLCALKEKYPELENEITKDFISNTKSEENKYKLKQNYSDNSIFKKIVSDPKEIKNKKSKIYKAYFFFKNYIKNLKINNPNDYYNIIKNLIIVRIEVKGKKTTKIAQTIFEKFNSTGEPLKEHELIRNFLLLTNKKQQIINYKLWSDLEEIIPSGELDHFLRAYTILKTTNQNIVISKKNIYREFKNFSNKQISDKNSKINDREKILKDIIYYAFYYRYIYDCTMHGYDDEGKINNISLNDNTTRNNNLKKLKPILCLLNTLGATELLPLFLQLFDKKNKYDFEGLDSIMDLLLNFLLRYRITGVSKGGGALTIAIKSLIKEINNNKIKATENSIHKFLSNYHKEFDLYPNDKDFKRKLLDFEIDNNYAKAALYQIERKYDLKGVEFDTSVITIEHLMPQTINPEKKEGKWWIKNLGGKDEYMDIYKEYLNRIGNLAIITFGKNDYLSNNDWEYKKEKLSKDKFNYTKQAAENYVEWNEKNIINRTNELTKILVKYITGPKTK